MAAVRAQLMHDRIRVEQRDMLRAGEVGHFLCAQPRLRNGIAREFGIAFYAVAQYDRRGKHRRRRGRKRVRCRQQRAQVFRRVARLPAVRRLQVVRAEHQHHGVHGKLREQDGREQFLRVRIEAFVAPFQPALTPAQPEFQNPRPRPEPLLHDARPPHVLIIPAQPRRPRHVPPRVRVPKTNDALHATSIAVRRRQGQGGGRLLPRR